MLLGGVFGRLQGGDMQRSQWRHFSVLCAVLLACFIFVSCQVLEDILGGGENGGGLSTQKIAAGLKEALVVGTGNAAGILNKQGGYFLDDTVKILLPPEAKAVETQLRKVPGVGDSVVNDVVLKMNRGAEVAAEESVDIFVDVVTNMTIDDAKDILFSTNDTAATDYLKDRMTDTLVERYGVPIEDALESVGAATIWRKLTTEYNKFIDIANEANDLIVSSGPTAIGLDFLLSLVFGSSGMTKGLVAEFAGREKIETNLVRYVTGKAIDGLFRKVEIEEREIRTNVNARVSDLLVEVFGYRDKNK